MNTEQRTDALARACHSAWYAYTVLALGEDGEPWETAPDWQKASIREGIRFWDEKMETGEVFRDPSTSIDEAIHFLAPLSHENWMKHKTANGWVYGETKDPEKKTHPCMVAYGDLPEDQRKKDEVALHAYLAVRKAI